MIVTAHQPNFIPGLSVIEKVCEADAVIWLDEAQYSHGGWTNRNRMPDRSWLTVPVERETDMAPLNRVRISETGCWRGKHAATLERFYGGAAEPLTAEIVCPYRLLVGLNLALLRVLLEGSDTVWHFQSHLDGGRATAAVSMDPDELQPISARLALMVAELGGDVYLSGATGRNYLDERPFHDLGITVDYFDWRGRNHCSACLLTAAV
jgi:WbqC-like protein family